MGDHMQLFIYEEADENQQLHMSAGPAFALHPRVRSVVRVDDFPNIHWEVGIRIGFPVNGEYTSDDYWIEWYMRGVPVWEDGEFLDGSS